MNKVYATSDWHGADIELIDKVFNFLGPKDKLYFLGDAIDRGGYGYENLKINRYPMRIWRTPLSAVKNVPHI